MVTKTLNLDNISSSPNQILANEELRKMESQMARYMQESMLLVLRPVFPSINRMFADLNKSLMKSLSLTLPSQGYSLPGITRTSVSKRKVDEDREEVISGALEAPTFIPTPTTDITVVKPQAKSPFGLSMISGGSFQYRGKTLENMSLDSKHGRAAALFLNGKDCFISNATIFEGLEIYDSRDFSWVLRNLKRAFKKNNLLIVIEPRRSPEKGYILIDIRSLN